MPGKPRDVTDAEEAVLHVLWDRGPSTIRTVTDVVYPDDPETQYFVDGMMDVILTNLSRFADLDVTSRTSVEQYRDRQPKPTSPQIGRELNVNYLVEASVRRFGDRMRITVQLIDATKDKHIWADNYNAEWTDILQLESDLSLQIAEQLQGSESSQGQQG